MTLQELLVFRINLQKRKENFDAYRISNSIDQVVDESVKEKKSKQKKEASIKENTSSNEDLVVAMKSYAEKVKLGFFGKKVRRV